MGIKVVLLLFCVVVVTECQIGPDFFYPGSFFNSYSNNRNDNTSPFKNPPGTFHSQTKPQLSINPYAGFTSQQQLQLNQRGDQEEQEYKKPQSTFGQQPQKNSRNPSATSNNSFEPTKSQYEQNQNIDRKQQSINRGQNSEYSPTSSNLNYNNQDQSGLTENSQRFPSQSNKPQSGFSPSYQSGQQSGQSNLRPGLSNQGQSYNGNRNNPSISSQPNNYYRPVSQGQQQVGLNSQNRQPNPQNPYVQREEEEKKYEDYSPITEFSWNLFKRAVITQKPNFVISPLSPQHILSYLASGAEGETRNEIITAIKYNSPNQLNSLISTMLREPGNKELQLASALFVSDRIRIREDFKRNLADNTKIVSTDFSNTEKFNREYSKWVAEKTKGVIKNSRINPEPHTRMLMTSAVYFKGEWIFKLNPGGIDNFYVDDNTPVKVPMMKLLKKLPYGKLNSGDAEWISLPYNSNDSMVIVLPRKGLPVEALIERLNVQEIFNSMNIDNYGNITLTLPRFKVESSSSLINPLQQMGIRQLFSTNAQLPNIFQSSEPLQVSNVLQQASLEVNEEGSIATSLTAFAVVALSFSPPTPDVVFTVDRPFIAMIIDRKNNFPYFIAKISNPAV